MGEKNVYITQDENFKGGNLMGLEALIPIGLGLGAGALGIGKGKETEYAAMAPEYQQRFAEEFTKFLQGQIGWGATPYGGQIAASATNPFTQSAFGLWGASPYGQFSVPQPGMEQPQMPPPPGGRPHKPPTDIKPPGSIRDILEQLQAEQSPTSGWLNPAIRQMPGMFGQIGNAVQELIARSGKAPQQPMPQQGGLGGGMPPSGQRPMSQQGMGGQRRGVPFRR